MKPSWRNVQIALSLIGFFAVLVIAVGIVNAALVTLSILVAYFVEFYVARTAVQLLTLHAVKSRALLISALAVAAGAILVYMHFANILGIAIACFFVTDAAILRFRYTPIE